MCMEVHNIGGCSSRVVHHVFVRQGNHQPMVRLAGYRHWQGMVSSCHCPQPFMRVLRIQFRPPFEHFTDRATPPYKLNNNI